MMADTYQPNESGHGPVIYMNGYSYYPILEHASNAELIAAIDNAFENEQDVARRAPPAANPLPFISLDMSLDMNGFCYYPILEHASNAELLIEEQDAARRAPPAANPRTRRIIDEDIIIKPNYNDVKCGRGSGSNLHTGNQIYLGKIMELLELHPRYNTDYELNEKRNICEEIIHFVRHDLGGRFLQPTFLANNQTRVPDYWVLASESFIKGKVLKCLKQHSR